MMPKPYPFLIILCIGLYDVDLGIKGAEDAGLRLMAIGDVDSDGYADLITVSEREDTFYVHFYDPASRTFANSSSPERLRGGSQPKIANIVVSRNMQVL